MCVRCKYQQRFIWILTKSKREPHENHIPSKNTGMHPLKGRNLKNQNCEQRYKVKI
jgi:hypothetical protein